MEKGRSSRKRKAEEGRNTLNRRKKKKKEEKEQRRQGDVTVTPSLSRDRDVLKQKRKQKKPITCGGAFAEEEEERSNGVSVCTEQAKKKAKNAAHLLCELKEHHQAQEDSSHRLHVDHNAFCDRTKREPKKVRFFDQSAPCKCKQNVSEDVCTRNSSAFKESLANDCTGDTSFIASCICNKGKSKEVPPQDESMNLLKADQVRTATDEKGLCTRKRQKEDDDEVWGKRFTPEEDELLKNAVLEYVKLRDNINWDDIADALGTHSHTSCCSKWYANMSSSMVIDGLWASEDDCLLLKSLLESGASTEEEVEWHRLLTHRPGQLCIVRWKQMVKYLGENRTRGFLEKLDGLVRRYSPELLSHEDGD